MSDVKCARALMEAANRDVEALRGMADASVFADEIFGFHVQQGAEKLFKAWIALLGKTYPLTHNLAALLNLLADRGIDTMPFRELIGYTAYAVEFRYEGIESDTDPIDRESALALVETLQERVQRLF